MDDLEFSEFCGEGDEREVNSKALRGRILELIDEIVDQAVEDALRTAAMEQDEIN